MKSSTILIALILITLSTQAAVPRLMTVQGRLKESGSAVTGSYDITFYIYNVETDGSPLYTEAHTGANSVSVSGGFFSVVLGEISTLNLPFKEQYWLALKVGSDDEMSPRIKLTNSSYAFVARDLNVAANLDIDAGTLYVDIENNRVGIGTQSPQQVFQVSGNAVRITDVATPMLELYPSTGDQWKVQSQSDSTFSVFNVTDGKTYLVIDGSGNVGIEKTPSYKLDVNGIVNATQYYQGGSPLISGYWTLSGSDIYYNSGNVGIGTASPAAKLDVAGIIYADSYVRIDGYLNLYGAQALSYSSNQLTIGGSSAIKTIGLKTGGVETVTILENGNVGIGTTSPDYNLDVSGTGRFTGALTLGTQATGTDHAVRADRTISTGTGLTGGGNLTSNLTISPVYAGAGLHVMGSHGRQASGSNLNDLMDSGVYGLHGSHTNQPGTGNSYDVLFVGRNSDVGFQLHVPRQATRPISLRSWSSNGDSWTSWRQLVDTELVQTGGIKSAYAYSGTGSGAICDCGSGYYIITGKYNPSNATNLGFAGCMGSAYGLLPNTAIGTQSFNTGCCTGTDACCVLCAKPA